MTPQELKNSILQLAIRGKLVEQRPEEGTAEELYKQIQAEKQKLIKVGTIKKEKPLPEITEDEKPFEIPESWKWVRLNNLTLFIKAGGDKPQDFSEVYTETHTVPVIANGIQNDGIIGYTREATVYEPCITVSGRGTIGFSCIRTEPFCPIIRLLVLNISKELLQKYIQIVLTALLERGVGTSIQQLTVPMLEPKLIPIPPLAEQKRIVVKIEELLPYIERYEQAWSKLEDFNKRFPTDMQKSILQMAIQGKLVEQRPEEGTGEELYQQIQAEKQKLIKAGTIKKEKPLPEIAEDEIPFDIPESWTWVRLGEVFETSSGTTPLSSNPDYYANGKYNWVRTTDLNNSTLSSCDIQVSEKAYVECNLKIIPMDSVCVAMYGGAGTIGKNALIAFDTTINQSVCAIHPNSFCDMRYVQMFMQYQRQYWMDFASGSRKDPNINKIIIKKSFFPLPPLAEQKRIVAKLEEILPLCEKLK